jgi:hypothetical protein
MEPSEDEAKGIRDIGDLAEWVGISASPPEGDGLVSQREALFQALGVEKTTHLRVLANISATDLAAVAANLRVNELPASPALQSQMGLLGQAARVMMGVEPGALAKQKALEEQRARELQLELAKATATAAASERAGRALASVKLSSTIDQLYDEEVPALEETQLQVYYATYRSKMGGDPTPDEDLTAEQLASLEHLLKTNRVPYCDFAIWGPFGMRIRRKAKFSGLVIGSDSRLSRVELMGPGSFPEWKKSFRVLRTGLIMLDQVDPSTLDGYHNLIEKYATRYGPDAWAVVYQADVRMRLEAMERWRRTGVREEAEAKKAGGVHPYSPDRPWNWVFIKATADVQFWHDEVEQPSILVAAKANTVSEFVEDAPPRAHGKSKAPPGTGAERPAKEMKQHLVGSDGKLYANRRGTRLCASFQTGECSDTRAGPGAVCAKDSRHVHQCNVCLSPQHGGNACSSAPARSPKGSGKGKGGQQGKGKGGKRFPY